MITEEAVIVFIEAFMTREAAEQAAYDTIRNVYPHVWEQVQHLFGPIDTYAEMMKRFWKVEEGYVDCLVTEVVLHK